MKKAFIAAVALFFCVELTARAFSANDIPIYDRSEVLGYMVKPSQSGSFFNKYDWAFNEHRMGVARPFVPSERNDIVLIADSIVYGWPPYTQETRLGPQLEKLLGGTSSVWPVSADSWALLNELAYLREYPEVVAGADRFVFILNSGDFGQASRWRSGINTPIEKPLSAVFYLFQRWVMPKSWIPLAHSEPRAPLDWAVELKTFADSHQKPITIFLYPDASQADDPDWASAGAPLTRLKAFEPRIRIVVISRAHGWNSSLYRDPIHPTAQSNSHLAYIISGALD